MALIISLPNIAFVYLASVQPEKLLGNQSCVFIEQFGYGFGFTAYMLYMIYFSDGEHKTAHYAICTAFMALGMMLPQVWPPVAGTAGLRKLLHLGDDLLYRNPGGYGPKVDPNFAKKQKE